MNKLKKVICLIIFIAGLSGQDVELLKAAENGDSEAQYKLGKFYIQDSLSQDYDKVVYWLTKAIDLGNMDAAFLLGKTYLFADTTQIESAKYRFMFENAKLGAGILLTMAAFEGHIEAIELLGKSYSDGVYFPQDLEMALFYWRAGAYQGSKVCQYMAGLSFLEGLGVDKNPRFAKEFLEKSAKQGYITAQWKLGGLYSFGIGTLQDPDMAFYWWHQAAIQDDPGSQYMVGDAYASGVGVNKDLKESAIWIRKAYDNGLEQAKQFWEENELWKY